MSARTARLTLGIIGLLVMSIAGLFVGAWVAQLLLNLMGVSAPYWPVFVLNVFYSASTVVRLYRKGMVTVMRHA